MEAMATAARRGGDRVDEDNDGGDVDVDGDGNDDDDDDGGVSGGM